jgi:16S rRNA (cytosine967-C5)-methyltransferase
VTGRPGGGRRPAGGRRPTTPGAAADPGASATSADPARTVAADLLRAVAERGAYANLALPGLLRAARLTGRDAAFATELGYGTLRRQGSLDAVLASCAHRPPDELDDPVLELLRLGAYQVLHTRVPVHAAVSTSVDLARCRVGPGAARFVNAVLRRVAERDWPGWLEVLVADRPDPVDRLALEHGYPRWIAAAFADALSAGGAGDPVATGELAAALAAGNRAEVHLVARPGRILRDDLLAEAVAELGDARAAPYSPVGVRLGGGDPARLPAIAAGRAAVQDEGSQLTALAVAGAPLTGPDRRWLDLAAGPGGKAALLAGVGAERGTGLLAGDRAAGRARLALEALRRAAGPRERALVVQADGRQPAWRAGSMDRVLLDAPCTGLGALRRRPELRWRRRPGDLPGLTALQRRLLAAALASCRPGGVVGYVTCSPHLAETRAVVDDVIAATAGVRPLDARPLLAGVPDLGPGPHVQLWPHRQGTDAMFLALVTVP